jgi:hypothetical protein
MVPETVAAGVGEVIETVGGVVSTVAGLLVEPMSPAQAVVSMAKGRTSSHSLWAIVPASCVTNLLANMIEPSFLRSKGMERRISTAPAAQVQATAKDKDAKLVSGSDLVQ